MNWDDASSFCKNHGMNLIAIDTPTQLKNVKTVVEQNKIYGQIWTSGTDFGHENIFVWSSNGQLFDYIPWHLKEPNNFQNEGEDCVTLALRSNKFGLNDEVCSRIFKVICSSELN